MCGLLCIYPVCTFLGFLILKVSSFITRFQSLFLEILSAFSSSLSSEAPVTETLDFCFGPTEGFAPPLFSLSLPLRLGDFHCSVFTDSFLIIYILLWSPPCECLICLSCFRALKFPSGSLYVFYLFADTFYSCICFQCVGDYLPKHCYDGGTGILVRWSQHPYQVCVGVFCLSFLT